MADATSLTPPSPGLNATLFPNKSVESYSMVLRSEGSLKLEMTSLARTSKYVDNTSVLSINKTEEDS